MSKQSLMGRGSGGCWANGRMGEWATGMFREVGMEVNWALATFVVAVSAV